MLSKDKQRFPNSDFFGITPVSTVRNTYSLERGRDGIQKLVVIGKEDLFEIVQSSREQAMDAILDRFLDGTASLDDCDALNSSNSVFSSTYMKDFFDISDEYFDMMEETREALNLPDDMSYEDISSYLQAEYKKYKESEEKTNEEISETSPQNAQSEQPSTVQTDSTSA